MAAIPRPAVSVLLTRRRAPGGVAAEVLMVRRSPRLRAFAGLWAFPGGTVAPTDAGAPVVGAASARPQAARLAAAARELFEETGISLVRGPSDSPPALPAARRDALRTALLADEIGFAEVLAEARGELRAADLAEVETLVTPASAPYRFDTRFYVAELPPRASVTVWDGEIVDAAWLAPEEALRRWRDGSMPLASAHDRAARAVGRPTRRSFANETGPQPAAASLRSVIPRGCS